MVVERGGSGSGSGWRNGMLMTERVWEAGLVWVLGSGSGSGLIWVLGVIDDVLTAHGSVGLVWSFIHSGRQAFS